MSASKDYKLKDLTLVTQDGEKWDIRDLCMELNWYESIDSPFIRCDISILDAVNFDEKLRGDEYITFTLETFASKKTPIVYMMQVYKVGAISKSERSKVYILHCGSPELYNNEANRAFGCFGPVSGKPEVVERMIKDYLKAPAKMKHKGAVEPYSFMNVVSPNWRPVDVISYISDKVCRKKGGGSKGGKRNTQSGYLFFENKFGYNFKSMDGMCEEKPYEENFVYEQSNVMENNPKRNAYTIENIKYPDRTNHLEKMRMGVYKTCTHGMVIPAMTEGYTSQPALSSSGLFDEFQNNNTYNPPTNKTRAKSLGLDDFDKAQSDARGSEKSFTGAGGEESFTYKPGANNTNYGRSDRQIQLAEKMQKPGGTVSGPIVTVMSEIFKKASKLEEGFPYNLEHTKEFEEYWPTRTKFKILPKYAHQDGGSQNSGADEAPDNVLLAASYAAARYSLLNTMSLTITIPGNTALYAGQVIKVKLPDSRQSSKRLPPDRTYSGKYLIKGLKHVYNKTGVTTELYLCRDSIPASYK